MNLALTVALMTALIIGVLPMPVLFMVGFAIALVINYPNLAEQRRRVVNHAGNVLSVVSLIFAAGIFTGILNNTGMVEAMSHSFLAVIPESWGPYLAVITAVASMPFTFFMSNDAFYFGVLPILSEAAGNYGITPVEMARASLAGQPVHLLSPLVPSTYLLVGLAKVEFADHQKFTLKWAIAISMLLMIGSLLFGLYPRRLTLCQGAFCNDASNRLRHQWNGQCRHCHLPEPGPQRPHRGCRLRAELAAQGQPAARAARTGLRLHRLRRQRDRLGLDQRGVRQGPRRSR